MSRVLLDVDAKTARALRPLTCLTKCGLSKRGNVLFIGKQLGDYSKIVAHAKLSANGADAIGHIKTAPGRFSQFVMVIGTGPDQVVEIVQHELGPLMLWILTTNAD